MPNVRSSFSLRLLRTFTESTSNPDERKSPADLCGYLELGLLAFKNLNESYESWRDRVFAGDEEASEPVSLDYRAHFIAWMDAVASATRDIKTHDWDGQEDEVLRLMSEVRNAQKHARSLLESWELPKLATNPAFRHKKITAEAFQTINNMIDSGAAALTVDPQPFASRTC